MWNWRGGGGGLGGIAAAPPPAPPPLSAVSGGGRKRGEGDPGAGEDGVPAVGPGLGGTRLTVVEVGANQRFGARVVRDGRVRVSRVEEIEKLNVRLTGGRKSLAWLRTVDAERSHDRAHDVEARPPGFTELPRAKTPGAGGRRERDGQSQRCRRNERNHQSPHPLPLLVMTDDSQSE